jgi:SET domain-containing protein
LKGPLFKGLLPQGLKALTEGKSFCLSSDQQEKIKPILQDLHNATVKLFQDENMSRDESLSKVRDSRFSADKKIRALLNDDQKKKNGSTRAGAAP